MDNAVVFTLSLYDVIGITRYLLLKLRSFSNIAQPLHKEAVRVSSFLYIIAKKSVIMSEAFLVDVSIWFTLLNRPNRDVEKSFAKGWAKGCGVLEVRTWIGTGVSVLVCARGAALEMDWQWFGVFQ